MNVGGVGMDAQAKTPNRNIRYQREARGWSQKRLADELDTSREMVSKWERGEQNPGKYYQEKLCTLFGKTAHELGFISEPNQAFQENSDRKLRENNNLQGIPAQTVTQDIIGTVSELEGNIMDQLRRQFLQQMLNISGTAVLPSHLLFNIETWERLTRTLNKHKPSNIDEGVLNELETILESYWRLFYSSASSNLLSGTLGFFHTTTSLLEYSYPTALEQRLYAIASKMSLLAGKIALDQYRSTAVDGYYKASLQAAEKVNDTTLLSVILARIASSLVEKMQPESALSLFQKAQRLCSPKSSTITYTWLAVHEAEAWAMMGQENPCLKALEIAEYHSDTIVPGDDPYWTGFDRSLLFGFKGVCNLKLHKSEEAYQALQRALALASPLSSRQIAIFFSDLAATFVQRKELEEACAMIKEALQLVVSTKSTRVMQRLLRVRSDLENWSQEPCIKRLDEQLITTQYSFL